MSHPLDYVCFGISWYHGRYYIYVLKAQFHIESISYLLFPIPHLGIERESTTNTHQVVQRMQLSKDLYMGISFSINSKPPEPAFSVQ